MKSTALLILLILMTTAAPVQAQDDCSDYGGRPHHRGTGTERKPIEGL